MNVIVCIDERGAMLFNHRRVARDKAVYADILKTVRGERLFIKPYSEKLFLPFADEAELPTVTDDPLSVASGGEWCFIEDEDITPYYDKIEKLLIYFWDCTYPFELKLDVSFVRANFRMSERKKFAGAVHDAITRELYRKDFRSK